MDWDRTVDTVAVLAVRTADCEADTVDLSLRTADTVDTEAAWADMARALVLWATVDIVDRTVVWAVVMAVWEVMVAASTVRLSLP